MRRPLMWICLLGIALCVWWVHLHDVNVPTPYTDGETLVLQGRVARVSESIQRTTLYLSEISDYGESATNSIPDNCIGVICHLQSAHELKAGQLVVVKGVPELIEGERNPGEFSFRKYYLARGYSHRIRKAELIHVGEEYDPIKEWLVHVSQACDSVLQEYLSRKDYGLMKALLLGDKSDVDEERKTLFQSVGIYHILAISGLHITFIGNLLYSLLRKIKVAPCVSLITSLTILILYAIMTGVSLSTVRAIIMFIICMGGRVFLRTYDMLTAMSVAAFLTILMNPHVCMDTGFQLSYLAVSGVAILFPALPGVDFRRVRIQDTLWIGLSTWLLTLPVIIENYCQISFYGIPANMLILPSVTYLMLLGIGIFVFHRFVPLLSQLCANGCHLFLHYYDVVVVFIDKLPLGAVVTGKGEAWQYIVYLTGIVVLSFLYRERKRKHYLERHLCEMDKRNMNEVAYLKRLGQIQRRYWKEMCVELLALLVLVIFLLADFGSKEDEIVFLDVGQGDGICMDLQEGVYLIDGGSTSESSVGESILYPFLKAKGIHCIDGWFLTHPDKDHVSALLEYNENLHIRINRIFIPGCLLEEFKEIREFADNNNIEVCVLFAGDVVQLKQWRIEVISPARSVIYEEVNDASLVLAVRKEGFTALMMGDAGITAQEAVLARDIEDVMVLKVAHHGSAVDTNTADFLEKISARIAVISCAYNNMYGHPHRETLQGLIESGSDIYRTDLQGAIRLQIAGDSVTVSPHLTY